MGLRFVTRLALVAAAALVPAAGRAAPATATASAVTLRPLSVVKVRDLDFGRIVAGTTAGTASIDPNTDGQSATGGTVAAGGTPQAAQFFTYGGPLQFVQVYRGALPTLTNGTGGSMNVTALTLNNNVTGWYLNAAGVLDLRVGGTLAVGANQAEGVYTGTFQIIVNYY